MAQFREALRRYAALAAAHFDRVARHKADHHEGDEHQRHECRDRQRQTFEEEGEHARRPQ